MNTYKLKNDGFSLIELLVAMAAFMFVMIPVMASFTNSYKSYLLQDDVAGVQQNVRMGMLRMVRDIRMAGSGMEGFTDWSSERRYGIEFENGAGPNDSDILTINYIDPDFSPCEDDNTPTNALLCSDLPPLTLEDEMPESSAIATVSEGLESEPYTNWGEDCYCRETYGPPKPHRMVIVTTPNGSRSETLFITNVNENKNNQVQNRNVQNNQLSKEHQDNLGLSGRIENKVLNAYPPGSTIDFFDWESFVSIQYFLSDKNELMRKVNNDSAQAIANNVEDLQFAFIMDDGTTANGNDALGGDRADHVRRVRASLLGRTEHEYSNATGVGRPDKIEDHELSATTDAFQWRLLQETIELRVVPKIEADS